MVSYFCYNSFINKIVPLNKIYVAQSEIPGADRGVFAHVAIKKGETIETCPIIEIPDHELSRVGEGILATYVYFYGEKKESLLVALGFGSIYNHSYTPNATYKIKPTERIIEFIALKNIKKDKEIIVNYIQENDRSVPLWFEE